MKDRSIARLSKQQKFILVHLLGCEKFGERYSSLIRDVAEEFSEGQGDKVFDYRKLVGNEEKKEELIKNFLDLDPETTEITISPRTVEKRVEDPSLKVRKFVGPFPQSFSRSVRRLKERGLVVRDPGVWNKGSRREKRGEKTRFPIRTKTKRVLLTGRGKKIAEEIKRRVEDGRYKLDFDTL
ncbi:hypothetical protein AKJ47_01735 [candidate division MSBL1 archaeon SCGC-AAA261G05]|uniref:Uncharacterized protein n=1 Tax=candidate division MSBL1 archaeon SCGC-AAA261G05 TaxID=1698276 RepID=A0A133VB95_9EURY|nr:hypothetical protein AKJ47_01735 [candidate division MSBL1 archaeon SCGC-AAA261G05]